MSRSVLFPLVLMFLIPLMFLGCRDREEELTPEEPRLEEPGELYEGEGVEEGNLDLGKVRRTPQLATQQRVETGEPPEGSVEGEKPEVGIEAPELEAQPPEVELSPGETQRWRVERPQEPYRTTRPPAMEPGQERTLTAPREGEVREPTPGQEQTLTAPREMEAEGEALRGKGHHGMWGMGAGLGLGPSWTLGLGMQPGEAMFAKEALQDPEIKRFLDQTKELRRDILMAEYDFIETARDPNVSQDALRQRYENLKNITLEYYRQVPMDMSGALMGLNRLTALGPLTSMHMTYLRQPEVRTFLDETSDLRRNIILKKFQYLEALRDPQTSPQNVRNLHNQLKELTIRLYERSPAGV